MIMNKCGIYATWFYVLLVNIVIFHKHAFVSAKEVYSWDNILPSSESGRLNGPIISSFTDNRVQVLSFCVMTCVQLTECQSINFLLGHVCELLNVTSRHDGYGIEKIESGSKDSFVHADIQDVQFDWDLPIQATDCGPHGIPFSPLEADTPICLCHQGWQGTGNCKEPVVTSWSEWNAWSMCSVSCGVGWRERRRECARGAVHCTGESQEYEECHSPCGVWANWSSWSDCTFTKDCGVAVKTRKRRCPLDEETAKDTDVNGQSESSCKGFPEESLLCDVLSCDAPKRTYSDPLTSEDQAILQVFHKNHWFSVCHDTFDDYAAETTCFEMGKNGLDKFSPVPLSDDFRSHVIKVQCNGIESSISTCHQEMYEVAEQQDTTVSCDNIVSLTCKVDGYFEPWGEWEECTLSCGGGTKLRRRECVGTRYGGKMCEGIYNETITCNEEPCPVDCLWLDWSSWSSCNVSCGGGSQARHRNSTGPYHGGSPCIGEIFEHQTCSPVSCPVDCLWLDWSSWSSCNVSCGGGSQARHRNSTGPYHGGSPCIGENFEHQTCSSNPCPVDCLWLDWSSWSSCNVSCGGGSQARHRNSTGPYHGGSPCIGENFEQQTCSPVSCPVDCVWLEWSPWSPCNVTCGGGYTERYRNSSGPFHGGNQCEGENTELDTCATNPCPVDGVWTDWSEWSGCSVTCGSGSLFRNRTCVGPFHGGMECSGSDLEMQNCSIQCTVQGDWSPWSAWSMCSVTCEGGLRSRARTCNTTEPINEDLKLVCEGGESEESESCHEFSCIPVAGSCEEWKELGLLDSTSVEIAPTSDTFWAFCNMEGIDGNVVTEIYHNMLGRQNVNGFESQGGFILKLEYNTSLENVIALVENSLACRQFISWECYGASIKNAIGANTYWLDRFHEPRFYWGGASHEGENCACGENGTCFDPKTKCNCDANDEVLRKDEGYLEYKLDLPVTQFRAGDTGGEDEYGFAMIGPIECYGGI